MFRKFLILLLAFANFVFSNDFDATYLNAKTSDPSGMVEGIVNVITGTISLNEPDFIVEGKEPIVFSRSYVNITYMTDGSDDLFRSNYMQKEEYQKAGWSFLKHTKAYLVHENLRGYRLDIFEPSGNLLKYDIDEEAYKVVFADKKAKELKLQDLYKSGFSNSSSGVISARHNFKNHIVKMQGPKEIYVYAADGTKRYYSRKEGGLAPYTLKREKLTNGNFIYYAYDLYENLTEIKTTNPSGNHIYAQLNIIASHPDPTYDEKYKDKYNFVVIQNETKKKAIYKYIRYKRLIKKKEKVQKPFFLLENVDTPTSNEKITYHTDLKRTNPLLEEYTFISSKERKYKVNFYLLGTKNQDDIGSHITIGEDDKRFQRVSSLWAPLGDDANFNRTHRFYYDKIGEF